MAAELDAYRRCAIAAAREAGDNRKAQLCTDRTLPSGMPTLAGMISNVLREIPDKAYLHLSCRLNVGSGSQGSIINAGFTQKDKHVQHKGEPLQEMQSQKVCERRRSQAEGPARMFLSLILQIDTSGYH